MAQSSLPKRRKIEDIDIVRVVLIKDSDNHYRERSVKRPEDVVSLAKRFLAGEDREVFIAINLDQSLKINSIHVVAIGSLNAAIVDPGQVFKSAILSNASRIVIVHNHPSGNSKPSDEDKQMTNRLFQCGDLLGIKVEDHLIIGEGEYSHCMRFSGKETMWMTDKINKDNQEAEQAKHFGERRSKMKKDRKVCNTSEIMRRQAIEILDSGNGTAIRALTQTVDALLSVTRMIREREGKTTRK